MYSCTSFTDPYRCRCAKFIPRKQWIIVGSDDMSVRVFNYNTQERVTSFEAHQDYIRYIEVHPSQPYILTTSDDMTIKLWDWEKNWSCVQTYEGHSHYVMMARINPKDTNTFASASLDRSIKVWSLGSASYNFSLEGHERGVNCLDYYPGGDKPYIVSGADDFSIRVWDYQTRSCVSVMEGHSNNVCAVLFHARLPFILSGSEDGSIRIWHAATYRPESTLNYGFERAWTLAGGAGNNVSVGYDDGTIVLKLGREVPVASMDKNGKIILARNNVVYTTSVRTASAVEDFPADGNLGVPASAPAAAPMVYNDGERMQLPERELGPVELFPQTVAHNPNGRFVAVCGDNEYVIYTAQALRNKTFGQALDFCWAAGTVGDYATRDSTSKVKVFKNFKETASFRPNVSAEGMFGGPLLCVRGSDSVSFYDWDTSTCVRRIEVTARAVHWNDEGTHVAIASDEAFYVLKYHRDIASAAMAAGVGVGEGPTALTDEGVEAAFELMHEMPDKVRSGTWVGDCFIYTSAANRLLYYVGGETVTLAHLDRRQYVLGYLAREGRLFLIDKTSAITPYALPLPVLEYQTAVVRKDFASANAVLPLVPKEHRMGIAKFLETQGFKEQAFVVTDDPDMKFDLALQLGKLKEAQDLLEAQKAGMEGKGEADAADLASKWRQLLDLALARSNIPLAESCARAAGDLSALLLLYSSTGDYEGMRDTGARALAVGKFNIALLAYHSIGDTAGVAAVLSASGRGIEAEMLQVAYGKTAVSSAEQAEEVVAPHPQATAAAGAEEEEAGDAEAALTE